MKTELGCAETALGRLIDGDTRSSARLRSCLKKARRLGMWSYQPVWLSALVWHVMHSTVECDAKIGGPLRRGACLLRKRRFTEAATLYEDRLPSPGGRYLAEVVLRLKPKSEPVSSACAESEDTRR